MSRPSRRTLRVALVSLVAVVSAAASATSASATPAAATCASLEDCYDVEQMPEFLDVATGLVWDFIKDRYSPMLLQVDVHYVASGETGQEGCRDATGAAANYSGQSYEYCQPDNAIYVGHDFLWRLYSMGDAAAVLGLAHEFGHFIQAVRGVPAPSTPAESVRHEDQADCFAGAWFGYAEAVGEVEYPDDLDDLAAVLDFIGSNEDDPGRDHGTTAERTAAVNLGREGGVEACNGFYPSTPLRSERDLARWRAVLAELRRENPWLAR